MVWLLLGVGVGAGGNGDVILSNWCARVIYGSREDFFILEDRCGQRMAGSILGLGLVLGAGLSWVVGLLLIG